MKALSITVLGFAAAGLVACATPPEPIIPTVGLMTYTCAGGGTVPVTYLPGPNGQNALVLPAFGMNHNLVEVGGGGGIRRFAGLTGGSNVVWQLNGNTGTLSSINPGTGVETPSLSGCRPVMPPA
jgi:hypothetical protein